MPPRGVCGHECRCKVEADIHLSLGATRFAKLLAIDSDTGIRTVAYATAFGSRTNGPLDLAGELVQFGEGSALGIACVQDAH